MELSTQFIALLSILLTGAGTSIGIYVKFNNDLAIALMRISALEKITEHMSGRLEQQEDKVSDLLRELKDDIHGLRLLIEQNKS